MAPTPLESPWKTDFGDVLVAPKLPTESEIITKSLDPQGLGSPPATPRPPPLDTPLPTCWPWAAYGVGQHSWGCLAMGGHVLKTWGKVVHLGMRGALGCKVASASMGAAGRRCLALGPHFLVLRPTYSDFSCLKTPI